MLCKIVRVKAKRNDHKLKQMAFGSRTKGRDGRGFHCELQSLDFWCTLYCFTNQNKISEDILCLHHQSQEKDSEINCVHSLIPKHRMCLITMNEWMNEWEPMWTSLEFRTHCWQLWSAGEVLRGIGFGTQEGYVTVYPTTMESWVSTRLNLLRSVRLAKIAHFHRADSADLKSPEWEINMLLLINV